MFFMLTGATLLLPVGLKASPRREAQAAAAPGPCECCLLPTNAVCPACWTAVGFTVFFVLHYKGIVILTECPLIIGQL